MQSNGDNICENWLIMLLVSELIKRYNVFVLHGISIKGGLNNKEFSIIERYNHIIKIGTTISAFTFNCNADDLERHFFLTQGFIIGEGDIIHADKKDSGTMRNKDLDKYNEPQSLLVLDSVVEPEREGYNELLINNTKIFAFYLRFRGDGYICYTLEQIEVACKELCLPIYFFDGKQFTLHRDKNENKSVEDVLTAVKIIESK